MMTFLQVLIYLVLGVGAYWLSVKEGMLIRNNIIQKFGDRADSVYTEFYRKTQFIPKTESAGLALFLMAVALVAMVAFWPVITIGGGIYEFVIYKMLCRKYEVI